MEGIAMLIFGMVQCLVTPNCGGAPTQLNFALISLLLSSRSGDS
jgi:hypothetical protein